MNSGKCFSTVEKNDTNKYAGYKGGDTMSIQNSLSTAELKKIWSYEKLDNGTLRIKKYKGNDTYIEVPEKI